MEEKNRQKIELIKKSFELKNLKEYKQALSMLYKALEYDNSQNDYIELMSQIGDLHMLLKEYDNALNDFQKALCVNQNHSYSLQKCYEIYCETNQLQKALKLAFQMCEKEKTSQNYYNYLKALIRLEKYKDAIETFNYLDEAIKLDPDILYLISTINSEKRQLLLEKIISIDETHTKANMDLAQIQFENKNYNKVITYCLNLVEDHPMAYYYLAKIEQIHQNYSKALEYCLKAIALDNDEKDYYLDLAKIYIDLMNFDDAFVALKKSINYSISKNELESLDEKYFITGWILIKQNEISKAILNLNLIKKQSPYYAKAQILIEATKLNCANISNIITKLEAMWNNEQNNVILLDTLAYAYKELGLTKKAIETYQKALSVYPESIFYNLELVDLLIDAKDYLVAIDLIRKLSEKCQNCPTLYNSMARIYYRLDKYDEALSCIEQYLKLDYNCAEAQYFKGLILNNLEQYEEASKCIYNAIKLNPVVAKYYNQMAKSYFGLNEFENALLYCKEAIEIDPNEINYKKFAYDISLKIGNKDQIEAYKNQLKRSEKILKLQR